MVMKNSCIVIVTGEALPVKDADARDGKNAMFNTNAPLDV